MKSETIDYLTFFICCKLEAEAKDLAGVFSIKDFSICDVQSVSEIHKRLQYLAYKEIIEEARFVYDRNYTSNQYRDIIIETASDPMELERFDPNYIDSLNCSYYIKIKNISELKKITDRYIEEFINDDLDLGLDAWEIQERKTKQLILDRFRVARNKKLDFHLNSNIPRVDLLLAFQAYKYKKKVKVIKFVNRRELWHDDMGYDPQNYFAYMFNNLTNKPKEDKDKIIITIEILEPWLTEIKREILLENARVELKHYDGEIWIQIGDKNYPVGNPSAIGEKYEIFKYIHSCKPHTQIELKNMPEELKTMIQNNNYRFGKLLTDIGFKGHIRKLFFYEIKDDSLKYRGPILDKNILKDINITIDELFNSLEEVKTIPMAVSVT